MLRISRPGREIGRGVTYSKWYNANMHIRKVLVSLIIIFAVSVAAVAVFVANTKPVVPATVKRFEKDDNKAERYMIDIKYPEIAKLGDETARVDMNARIKAIIDLQVGEFRKQVAEIKDYIAPEDMSSGLWIDYAVAALSNDFVSVQFTASNYAAGAAHPNNYSIVFNYDVRRQAEVGLADLFQPGSEYLKIISGYAMADLDKQFGEVALSDADWIKTGAAPTPENYRNFVIRGGQLIILFDPYQVAAYAAGGREVIIPTELIRTMLTSSAALVLSGAN